MDSSLSNIDMVSNMFSIEDSADISTDFNTKLLYKYQQDAKEFFENKRRLKEKKLEDSGIGNILQGSNYDIEIKNNFFKELSLSEKDWRFILKNEKRKNISHSILKTSIKYGIPGELRPRIWYFMCGISELKQKYSKNIYFKLKNIDSMYSDQIDKDVVRTYQSSFMFNVNVAL